MNKKIDVSIILPCLNEEKAINFCLEEIKTVIKEGSFETEVIVVDNNSTDRTQEIVRVHMPDFPELKLIEEKNKGYGSAYLAGFKNASGEYIFMADADGSYDFSDIPRFIEELKKGSDLVVGNRFKGGIKNDAMPWHHKFIGNPILSFITKLFFKIDIGDIHCGVRAFKKDTLEKIVLYTRGMEFASEMIIKFAKRGLKISEIPVLYSKRIGQSKLQSFQDGWRHLRFILLYSPTYLFLLPGIILFILGAILMIYLYFFNPKFLGVQLFVHPMFLFSLMVTIGYQLITFTGFARIYAITHLGDTDKFFESLFEKITLEKASVVGFLISFIGAVIYIYIFAEWINSGLGSLNEIKNSIIALTLFILGIQTVFSAFMLSILGIKER